MTSTDDDRLMTIREVSERVRRHRITVSRMVRDGELQASRGEGKNSRILIYESSVNRWLERTAVTPETRRAG